MGGENPIDVKSGTFSEKAYLLPVRCLPWVVSRFHTKLGVHSFPTVYSNHHFDPCGPFWTNSLSTRLSRNGQKWFFGGAIFRKKLISASSMYAMGYCTAPMDSPCPQMSKSVVRSILGHFWPFLAQHFRHSESRDLVEFH